MDKSEIVKYVMGEAAKSNVEKRKVGCVIMHGGNILGRGYNTDTYHAEIAALEDCSPIELPENTVAYVSQPPCPHCAETLLAAGVAHISVVEEFMKFDGDKPRYDLVPPSAIKAMADVLTFGARKYKPNNWRNCEELGRYVAATMRHFEAYRAGEVNDPDSGLPHLAHAMTNLAFLLELDTSES